MMKKMKRVAVDSSPSPSPSYAFGEEAKNRLKHQSLMQDYIELEKETEAVKKRMQKAKEKKLRLLAEVRFLRRRYKYLLQNPSHKIPLEQHIQPQVPTIRNPSLKIQLEQHIQPLPTIRNQSASKGMKYREKEASFKRPPAIDLNQKGEETEEFQVAWEPVRPEKKLKRRPVEGDAPASDLKLSVCRDVGNGPPNRSGKRKISWQDQVALKV